MVLASEENWKNAVRNGRKTYLLCNHCFNILQGTHNNLSPLDFIGRILNTQEILKNFTVTPQPQLTF